MHSVSLASFAFLFFFHHSYHYHSYLNSHTMLFFSYRSFPFLSISPIHTCIYSPCLLLLCPFAFLSSPISFHPPPSPPPNVHVQSSSLSSGSFPPLKYTGRQSQSSRTNHYFFPLLLKTYSRKSKHDTTHPQSFPPLTYTGKQK